MADLEDHFELAFPINTVYNSTFTIASNSEVIKRSNTVFWNGPQGVFEMKPFAKGSLTMLDDIIEATGRGAISVAGGGDTVALL